MTEHLSAEAAKAVADILSRVPAHDSVAGVTWGGGDDNHVTFHLDGLLVFLTVTVPGGAWEARQRGQVAT